MSDIWPHVTKQNACGACGKTDWCQIGDRGWRCYRVESAKPFKTGGWFHPFGDTKPIETTLSRKIPPPPALNAARLIKHWKFETPPEVVRALARELNVAWDALNNLDAAYAPEHRAYAFPMRDGYGEIIGIRLRSNDGRKWAVRGSKNGLFIPNVNPQPVAYLCEGPTSTAAALTMGLYTIGRPACHLGGPELKIALKRLGVTKAVIVADNDEKPNGLTPGKTGAELLSKEIGIRSVIWTPPVKDIRDFLKSGGTRQMIESDIKNFVWRIHK